MSFVDRSDSSSAAYPALIKSENLIDQKRRSVTKTISATEAARNFRAVLNDVEGNGMTFRIERHGQPIAELAPVGKHVRRFTGRDLVELLQEVPKLDADFASDVAAIHAEGNTPVRDPWE